MKTKKPKAKRVNEVVLFIAISYPSKQYEDTGGPIAWSCGYSHYEVLEKMREAYWPRRHYRIARCRLAEQPKKRSRKK